MEETGEHERIIDLSEKFLVDAKGEGRANVNKALEELKRKPEIIRDLIKEFDGAVELLNDFGRGKDISEAERERLPNAVEFRRAFDEEKIPSISQLEGDESFESLLKAGRTFREARERMMRGERKRKGEQFGEGAVWEFHQDVEEAGELAADLLLEMYGVYAERESFLM